MFMCVYDAIIGLSHFLYRLQMFYANFCSVVLVIISAEYFDFLFKR